MKTNEIIRQAQREIQQENKESKIVEVKNILRQIAIIKEQLRELGKQLDAIQ